ncbi:MAG TPA: SAM-dependent methyltransferase, partial [Burkholderiaceae bacterium]
HLDPAALPAAARTLRALLRPGGTLYASWRVTRGESVRDPQGRLYAVVDREAFLTNLGTVTVLFDREDLSASSAKPVHRLIVRA